MQRFRDREQPAPVHARLRRRRASARAELGRARDGAAGRPEGRGLGRAGPGWPFPPDAEAEVARLAVENGCSPVLLTEAEQEAFYGRICNETLWPLFHYFVDRMHFTREAWDVYAEVNERFAETIAARQRATGPGLGSRLPSRARSARFCGPPARSRDRVLPAHPVPVVGDLPAPPGQGRAPARDARGRLHRLPHGRLCPSFPILMPARARDRDRPRHDRLRRPHDRDRRAPDRDRRRELPGEPARPGDGAGRGRARRALRRAPARPRRRAARLHEGHPAEARRVRAAARAGPGARRPRDDAPGARALAARERGVPVDARRDRDADRPHQRALRPARALARRLRAPLGLAVRAGRALPSGRRDDGDAAP